MLISSTEQKSFLSCVDKALDQSIDERSFELNSFHYTTITNETFIYSTIASPCSDSTAADKRDSFEKIRYEKTVDELEIVNIPDSHLPILTTRYHDVLT